MRAKSEKKSVSFFFAVFIRAFTSAAASLRLRCVLKGRAIFGLSVSVTVTVLRNNTCGARSKSGVTVIGQLYVGWSTVEGRLTGLRLVECTPIAALAFMLSARNQRHYRRISSRHHRLIP